MKWRNREIVKVNGYTFTLVQYPLGMSNKWQVIREYVCKCDNHIFDSRDECIEFINKWTSNNK